MWSVDAWLCLTAAAERTTSIRLGTLLTPLSIMRPWKIAAAAVTLDQLSNGRVILTVGMGAIDVGFAEFGEEIELRTRAERVDEGLTMHQSAVAGSAIFPSRQALSRRYDFSPDQHPAPGTAAQDTDMGSWGLAAA